MTSATVPSTPSPLPEPTAGPWNASLSYSFLRWPLEEEKENPASDPAGTWSALASVGECAWFLPAEGQGWGCPSSLGAWILETSRGPGNVNSEAHPHWVLNLRGLPEPWVWTQRGPCLVGGGPVLTNVSGARQWTLAPSSRGVATPAAPAPPTMGAVCHPPALSCLPPCRVSRTQTARRHCPSPFFLSTCCMQGRFYRH